MMYVLSFSVLLGIAVSEIIQYKTEIDIDSPSYIFLPKYASNQVPHWSPGNGRNTIDASNLAFSAVCDGDAASCKANLEILMFRAPDIEGKTWKDLWPESGVCCTEASSIEMKCDSESIGKLLVPEELTDSYPAQLELTGDGVKYLTSIDEYSPNLKIKRAGVYILLFAVCDPTSVSIQTSGVVESINPYGYVPAGYFGDLPFYASVSLSYMLLGIAWVLMIFFHTEELMTLQHWISAVILLGMLESSLLFGHFLSWNDNGVISISILSAGLFFGVVKRSVSRGVVLMVTMGYGVVRPSIGEEMKRVMLLTGAYGVLSLIYTFSSSLPNSSKNVSDPDFGNLFAIVVMLLAAVDTTFYMWTINSLNNLIITLQSRRQTAKLLLYTRFRYVLILAVTFAFIWAFYGAYLVSGHNVERDWGQVWTIDALSETTYLIVFIAIVILWAPSRNNQRYISYVELSQMTPDEDDDIDAAVIATEKQLTAKAVQELDAEFGGSSGNLRDDDDPFQGTGALDPAMAIMKKN